MDLSDVVIASALVFAGSWWFTGLTLIAFKSPIYVWPGAPWKYRVLAVASAAWPAPWLFFNTGMAPIITIAPNEPEAEKAVMEWVENYRKEHCPCPSCRKRRGE